MNLDSKFPYAIAEHAVKTLREPRVDPTVRFELETTLLNIAKFAQDRVNRDLAGAQTPVKKAPMKKAAAGKTPKKRHKTTTAQAKAAPSQQAPKRRGRPPKIQQPEMFAS